MKDPGAAAVADWDCDRMDCFVAAEVRRCLPSSMSGQWTSEARIKKRTAPVSNILPHGRSGEGGDGHGICAYKQRRRREMAR